MCVETPSESLPTSEAITWSQEAPTNPLRRSVGRKSHWGELCLLNVALEPLYIHKEGVVDYVGDRVGDRVDDRVDDRVKGDW